MFPVKQLLFTFALSLPIQIMLVPVVTLELTETPNAVLESPVVFFNNAPVPMAVLPPPVLSP